MFKKMLLAMLLAHCHFCNCDLSLIPLVLSPSNNKSKKTHIFEARPSHILTCKAVCDLFKSTNSFAKRKLSHTVSCEAVCETNSIVPLRTKSHLTHLASQKVSQTVLCDSTETNLCRKKMEEREGTYKCCFEARNATLP